jgi:hypothetical protein
VEAGLQKGVEELHIACSVVEGVFHPLHNIAYLMQEEEVEGRLQMKNPQEEVEGLYMHFGTSYNHVGLPFPFPLQKGVEGHYNLKILME